MFSILGSNTKRTVSNAPLAAEVADFYYFYPEVIKWHQSYFAINLFPSFHSSRLNFYDSPQLLVNKNTHT